MCAAARARQHGASLVEVVLFIVIISIALSSVLGVLALSAQRSADPMLVRQSLAIAESLLQEIGAQPTGADDPDGGPDTLGPEAGEARGSASLPFDHVNDYHGYVMNGAVSADGTPVPALAGYRAAVTVAAQGFNGLPATHGWLVTVEVTGPEGAVVALSGFRARVQ